MSGNDLTQLIFFLLFYINHPTINVVVETLRIKQKVHSASLKSMDLRLISLLSTDLIISWCFLFFMHATLLFMLITAMLEAFWRTAALSLCQTWRTFQTARSTFSQVIPESKSSVFTLLSTLFQKSVFYPWLCMTSISVHIPGVVIADA